MTALDLRSYVTRSRALVNAVEPSSRSETRTWLVDPFLETLGWDVHADSCLTDVTVDETTLEYVCSVDGVPALFVAVEPFGQSLEKARAVTLLETMAWTGIDRAIYTNGREFLLLAGTTDAERLACRRPELPDRESAIAHYTRETVGQRIERHSREFVARQLAIRRPSLVDAIVDDLTDAIERGDAYTAEFESAADRFLERLVASFTDERDRADALESPDADVSIEFSETAISEDGVGQSGESTERGASAGAAATDVSSAERTSPPSSAGDDTDRGPTGSSSRDGTDADDGTGTAGAEAADGDGEYVVRFFNDRGSIGAIGHAAPDRALVGVAEYLFDRGLSGISVPWRPEDADRTVLNESPTRADGTPMDAPQQLSNGLYLETAGDTADRAARVEALVARAGLRAMLTGDWETPTENE